MDPRKRLATFPRRRLALLPTPLQRLERLSAELGADLWCKRDDLTGLGLGGNKARKLDFLVAEALERGADSLVTTGAVQSNFCRMVAAAGAAAGLAVHLILGGAEPSEATGNLLLDRLFGARLRFVPSSDWGEWERAAASLEEELCGRGARPYRMPIGGSTPTGALGYAEALVEIVEDERRLGIGFDLIIHASSSAGTQAGLMAGRALIGWPGEVLGMSVAGPAAVFAGQVRELARDTAALLGAPDPGEPRVEDRFLGPGYALPTRGCREAAELFARREGIVLDSVYTGKAAAGLVALAREGVLAGQRVLFLHTGGVPEVFAGSSRDRKEP